MSQEVSTDATTTTAGLVDWQAGVVAGIVGGAVMGVVVSAQNPMILKGAIAGLFGLQGSGVAGWVIHLAIASIFGVGFAALATHTPLRNYTDGVVSSAVAGLVFGVVTWLIGAGLIFPVWLNTVGFPMAPAGVVPNWGLPGTLPPHLVYGIVLGAVYPMLRGR